VLPVVEVLLQSAAHSNAMVGCDGEVTLVEERVCTSGAKQDAVVDSMLAGLGDGPKCARLGAPGAPSRA
jgi:hypothetical protein